MSQTKPTPQQVRAARYGAKRPKVPAFARYVGTSVWRSDRKRVRAYAMYQAAQATQTAHAAG